MRDEGGSIFEIMVLFGSYLSCQVRAGSKKLDRKFYFSGSGSTEYIFGPPRREVNEKLG